jgi:hypothetical protein
MRDLNLESELLRGRKQGQVIAEAFIAGDAEKVCDALERIGHPGLIRIVHVVAQVPERKGHPFMHAELIADVQVGKVSGSIDRVERRLAPEHVSRLDEIIKRFSRIMGRRWVNWPKRARLWTPLLSIRSTCFLRRCWRGPYIRTGRQQFVLFATCSAPAERH